MPAESHETIHDSGKKSSSVLNIIQKIIMWIIVFIIFFSLKSYWKDYQKDKKLEEENSVVVAPPRGSTTYYFYNQDTIKLKFYGTFKFYPKGGCIGYILPSGKEFEDCPGVDAYYPAGPPGEYMFVKKNKATAVEIVR